MEHEILKAEGVVDNQLTALVSQLNVSVLAAGVFSDVPLDNPIHINAFCRQGLGGGVLTADKVVGIALVVLVADADQAHLDALALSTGIAAGWLLGAAVRWLTARIAAGTAVVVPAAGCQRQQHCKR